MSSSAVVVTLKKDHVTARVDGARVTFSPHQCLAFNDDSADKECLRALGAHLRTLPGVALVGSKKFVEYLLKHVPDLETHIVGTAICTSLIESWPGNGLGAIRMPELPPGTRTVFLCETLSFPRWQMKKLIPASISVVDPAILAEICPEVIPARGWTPLPHNIYPIDIPPIRLEKGLDLAIVDCPSRNLSLMPNGLAYLNNALKKTDVIFQILDLDIIAYHRFHMHRLFDMGGCITLPGDLKLPEDPWQAEHYDLWTAAGGGASGRTGRNEVLEFFRPVVDEMIVALVEARPTILGLSIHGCNEFIARELALGVKAQLPDIVIVVGGFSCYNPDIGLRAFPECDYMCIGESDLTAGPLMEALAGGERPFNMPGVLSRFDTPTYRYLPAPMIHDLDQIEFPKYEWCDLSVYRNFNDYQLTPIIASRGCRWSRCTFCAERFYWRIRTPENFVDELEWLVERGCHLFMFNESDLGGMPERVVEICDEIIRRGLHRKVKLTGQLRVNKKQNRAFFERLRAANFVSLRFGVDAFSEHTLRLQMKGYTVDMISQNLKDCWEVGIFTEINWVIGVPGETDEDVTEGIELLLKNRRYIGRLCNINPLMLVNGSVYWIDPESHNIVFKEPKEAVYEKNPRAIPADQWYSTNPYIDAQVRKERFERIVIALHDAGFNIGAWANRIIDDIKYSRDKMRAGRGLTARERETSGRAKNLIARSTEAEEEGIEAAQMRSPSDEQEAQPTEAARYGKVFTLHAEKDNEVLAGENTAAGSPLFDLLGEPPHLVRTHGTHNIVSYKGWYYGIPLALGSVDLMDPEVEKMSGIIRHLTEEDLSAAIDANTRWANSRGQYDDQAKQRTAGTYMRVNSVAGSSEPGRLPIRPKILRFRHQYVAIDQQVLKDSLATQNGFRGEESGEVTVLSVVTKGAQPELMWAINAFNLVKYDGMVYGVPYGAEFQWDSGDLDSVPGMLVGETIRDVVAMIEGGVKENQHDDIHRADTGQGRPSHFAKVPILLESMPKEGYNIVSYEGWIYGLPQALGPIHLAEVDVMEMPGVIRDVSHDAVETEILARSREKAQAK